MSIKYQTLDHLSTVLESDFSDTNDNDFYSEMLFWLKKEVSCEWLRFIFIKKSFI